MGRLTIAHVHIIRHNGDCHCAGIKSIYLIGQARCWPKVLIKAICHVGKVNVLVARVDGHVVE